MNKPLHKEGNWIIKNAPLDEIIGKNDDFGSIENGGEDIFLYRYIRSNRGKHLVFFDIGGNEGAYSNLIKKFCLVNRVTYKIHIFEPLPESIEILKNKFKTDKNIIINNYALSNFVGSILLNYNLKEDSGVASIKNTHYDNSVYLNSSIEVSVNTLARYIEDNSIHYINFIKLDVEGAEADVLEGMTHKYLNSAFVDIVQFEYSCTYKGVNTLENMFNKYFYWGYYDKTPELNQQFRIAKIFPDSIKIVGFNPCLEYYRHCNYVAINFLFRFGKRGMYPYWYIERRIKKLIHTKTKKYFLYIKTKISRLLGDEFIILSQKHGFKKSLLSCLLNNKKK